MVIAAFFSFLLFFDSDKNRKTDIVACYHSRLEPSYSKHRQSQHFLKEKSGRGPLHKLKPEHSG